MLTPTPNPILSPSHKPTLPTVDQRRKATRERRAVVRDARNVRTAADVIGTLPNEGESLHILLDGRFSLWHLVIGLMELTKQRVRTLRLSTLGINSTTVRKLCELHDSGAVGRVDLVLSHYFKSTEAADFAHATAEVKRRPGMRLCVSRTHAKVVLMELEDGRCFVIESSSNLRTCRSLEQATVFHNRELHAFHRKWIEGVFKQEGQQ
jgi:hypothetical protein